MCLYFITIFGYFWIFLDCLVTLQQPVFGSLGLAQWCFRMFQIPLVWSQSQSCPESCNLIDTTGLRMNGEAERWKIQLGMLGNTQKSDRQNLQQMFVNPKKLSCFRIWIHPFLCRIGIFPYFVRWFSHFSRSWLPEGIPQVWPERTRGVQQKAVDTSNLSGIVFPNPALKAVLLPFIRPCIPKKLYNLVTLW